MKPTLKTLTLCSLTVFILLLQLVSPITVLADDETPPPPTEASEVATTPPTVSTPDAAPTSVIDSAPQDPSEASPASPETPVATSVPVSSPADSLEAKVEPSVSTGSSDEPAAPATVTAPPAEAPASSSVLEAAQTVADHTNVMVLDQTGQSLPLGSQAAAEVITHSDPVWCPVGQAPTPGSNGCTSSYATLSDLVTNEGGNIAADGTIWMTSGLIPEAGQVTINGSTYTTWSTYGLTLQGGWSGISGDQTIGSNTVFSVPIQIINWNNSVVINNVTIENVTTAGVPWLVVQSNQGDISLRHMNVQNNQNTSPVTAGVRLSTVGNVTIDHSNFVNSAGPVSIMSANLTIDHSNFVNLSNAESAVGYIALLDCSANTASNVVVTNSNFSDNATTAFSVVPVCYREDEQYNINTTIDQSTFDHNLTGVSLRGMHTTINNSSFTDNSVTGAHVVGAGTINNSVFSRNGAGAVLSASMTLNDVTFGQNDVGIETGCFPGIQETLNGVDFVGNRIDVGSKYLNCPDMPAKIIYGPPASVSQAPSAVEFELNCDRVDGYSVQLPGGNQVQLACPVSGRAHVASLNTTALPAPLPADYSYASAFSLDILQDQVAIPVITEGGYLKASFAATSVQAGNTYSVLYWDNGTWVPLKDFTLDENGSVQLNPDASGDPRAILSGVQLVSTDGSPRVEVSTNFPGIFVLAQH